MKSLASKKILIVLTVFVAVLALGLGTYWLIASQASETVGENGDERGPLFPFGGSRGPEAPVITDENNDGGVITTTPGMRPALWRVSERPTVASIAYSAPDRASEEDRWFVRYVERETMHVYEQEVVSRDVIRLSITNVPRIQEAFFLPGYPDRFVIRYLDSSAENIQTYRATLAPRDPENPPRTDEEKENAFSINGSFLEQNIRSIAPGTNGQIVYSVREGSGSAVKVVTADGTLRTVYTTPLREIVVTHPEPSTVVLNTKASYDTAGALARVNPNNGNDRIILTDRPSLLTSMNPRGDRFLAFTNAHEGGASFAVHNADGSVRTNLSLVTIPEKCVWSVSAPTVVYCAIPATIPGSQFPDAWYQGVTGTDDLLWKIDTETNTTTLLVGQADFQREGAEGPLDIINLAVSEGDQYLTFIDRTTDELWALRLFTPEL